MTHYVNTEELEKNRLDKMGMPLEVGDWIAYAESDYGNGYRIGWGQIHSFTPNFANLCDENGKKCGRKALNKTIKITKQIEWNKENSPEYFL
jgi:hypothetical protein